MKMKSEVDISLLTPNLKVKASSDVDMVDAVSPGIMPIGGVTQCYIF
jgi:hypothetical protein